MNILYNSWSSWRKKNYHFFEEELSKIGNDAIVIDLGAGKLQFKDLFSRFETITVDFQKLPGIDMVHDLTTPLPFPENYADAIVLSNTLEHIPEPSFLLGECYRILKGGGVLLGTTPFLQREHQPPYDFYRYTYYGLEYLLTKNSFKEEIISVETTRDVVRASLHDAAVSVNMHRYLEKFLALLLFLFIPSKINQRSCKGFHWIGRK